MIGAKPLTNTEVELILSYLKTPRDRCLFTLGLKTGYRISELLSLTWSDILQYGVIRDAITVERKSMKGKGRSRTVVLHADAKEALTRYKDSVPLAIGRVFPISRIQAHRVLKEAAHKARITGKVSTHSMRKSFAKRVYEALDKDLVATQRALGHKSVSNTVSYLSFDQEDINKAILGG